MAVSQRINVTFRCHVGTFTTEADLALPARSTINEVLAEVVDIIGAPSLNRPWDVTTAAGTPIDRSAPIDSVVAHGALICLSPAEDPQPPIVRDSAEALAHAAGPGGARGAAWAWAMVALTALGLVLSSLLTAAAGVGTGFAFAAGIAASAGFAVAAVLGLTLALWVRPATPVAGWLIALAAAAGWCGVSGWAHTPDSPGAPLLHQLLGFLLPPTVTEFALGAAIACACAAGALAITHATGLVGPRTAAATLTIITIVLASIGGVVMPGPESTPAPLVSAAAGALIAGLILLAIAPGLTTRAAGLTVPRLPTAGQSLDIADDYPDGVDSRAVRAQRLYEGLALGLTIALIPAWACMALAGTGLTSVWDGPFGVSSTTTGFAQGLALTYAGAVILHASRHASHAAAWALSILGLAAITSAAAATWIAASGLTTHPTTAGTIIWFIVAALALIAGATAPLWTPRIPHLEPTTIVWFERAESLAIAASLPLAAHLLGLFMLIRGLG